MNEDLLKQFEKEAMEELEKIPKDERQGFHNYINREYYKVFEKLKKKYKKLAEQEEQQKAKEQSTKE